MGATTATFEQEAEIIHEEHEAIIDEMSELESALGELVCFPEVFADLHSLARVRQLTETVARILPEHFGHEAAVLKRAEGEHPQLAKLLTESQVEHKALFQKVSNLRALIESIGSCDDLEQAVCQVKEQGELLARSVVQHIVAEERGMQEAV